MRRSICLTEPKYVYAGETTSLRFIYSPSTHLPKGSRLKFDPLSKGRDFDWEIPQLNSKSSDKSLWLITPQGAKVPAKAIQGKSKLCPQFEFVLPCEIKLGEEVIIMMGSDERNNGYRSQLHLQRRRPFHLYIDLKGNGDYKEPEIFSVDVKGNALERIRVIAPSMVAKNERFDVVIRFEDVHGNLTSLADEGTLIEFSYDQLRENLSWKLFVPETGFITVPNLYFNEQGVYRLKLINTAKKQTFYSSPIKCIESDNNQTIYWGVFHGESERFDASLQIESCLRHFRDDMAYHFYASSSFETEEETTNELWKNISLQISEFNEDDRFNTFLGSQWFSEDPHEGLRQLVFTKDNKPLLRKKEAKSTSLKKIYKTHTAKEVIGIPSFTMAKGLVFDFKEHNPEFEPVVEIYNAWGSSECKKSEGNLKPITSNGKDGVEEDETGSIRAALNKGHRFGFVAGGLDDRGVFSEFYTSEQIQYTPGLTAVVGSAQTRDGLIQSLKDRSCYATTGARMIIGLEIAGLPMGCVISTRAKPGLVYNRYIKGFVIGTDKVSKIEIIRNGKLLKTLEHNQEQVEFELNDSDFLEDLTLKSEVDGSNFVYYYMRAIQSDGQMAWSSPIWIELGNQEPQQPIKPLKPGKKT